MTIGNTYAFNVVYDYYDPNAATCGFLYLTAYNISRSPSFVNLTPAPTAGALEGGGVIYAAGAKRFCKCPAVLARTRYVGYVHGCAAAEGLLGFVLSMDGEIRL
jgi:hypothetical protein